MRSAVIIVSLLVLVSILFTGAARGHCALPRCDGDGWFQYNEGQCIKFTDELKTWPEAQENCRQLGANLVMIDNPWHKVYLRCFTVMIRNTDSEVWIGAKRSGGAFKRVDGSEVSDTFWAPGEPNNAGGNKDCVSMSRKWLFYWAASDCSEKKISICVKKK